MPGDLFPWKNSRGGSTKNYVEKCLCVENMKIFNKRRENYFCCYHYYYYLFGYDYFLMIQTLKNMMKSWNVFERGNCLFSENGNPETRKKTAPTAGEKYSRVWELQFNRVFSDKGGLFCSAIESFRIWGHSSCRQESTWTAIGEQCPNQRLAIVWMHINQKDNALENVWLWRLCVLTFWYKLKQEQ